MAPLYLEASDLGHWNISAFQKEIRLHASHICHLDIEVGIIHFAEIIQGLVSPAPILEYLSLFCERFPKDAVSSGVCIPDTLFDGIVPSLSCLKLHKCDISWKSPFLKGLRCLELQYPSASMRLSLSDWLDALDEMPQLQMLILQEASPIALPAPLPSDIKRTITLPSLSVFDLSASAEDCGLALAHLILPALTRLRIEALSYIEDGSDVQDILPYVSQHAHAFQDIQGSIQGIKIDSGEMSTKLDASTDASLPSAPLMFSFMGHDWSPGTHAAVFDATIMALRLENLLSLTSQNHMDRFGTQVWLHHARSWPLLQRVCLSHSAARVFMGLLLEDNGGCENSLLPSLTTLVFVSAELSARWTLRLCNVLMKRVEQGVPLDVLDLQECYSTDYAVRLLSEIVVNVLGPKEILKIRAQYMTSVWDDEAHGLFLIDTNPNSGIEDNDENDPVADTGSDDDVSDNWDIDDDEDEDDEDEDDEDEDD
jgi:hypothetical protein